MSATESDETSIGEPVVPPQRLHTGRAPRTEVLSPATPRDQETAGPIEDPLIGLLVDGRYRIGSKLARGGMATVYVAQDERLDRPVALKVMHPHLAESADFVARFRREARAAARIVHPGVVSVFDQGVVHGQGFLVMELVAGPNLRTLLQAQGAFTLNQALRYTQEVLDALRAAHRVGVIHRDIKPENVLVPAEPPVRVTDFGLARAASEVSMSTAGSVLGTVAYMAPEIATTGHTDARTDIFSVGIMLDEMLLGHIPWEGENPLQMAYSHVNADIPLPSTEQEWIPREVDDLVAALAARNPDERPADAHEAIDLIVRVRESLPEDVTSRRADVAPHETPAPGASTAALDFSGTTSSLPALAASSQTIVHTTPAPLPDEPALKKHGSRRIWTLLLVLLVVIAAGTGGGWWWWMQYGPGSYVDLPLTAGRSAVDVESDLTALGLASTTDSAFSDDVQSGDVISSNPEGSTPDSLRSVHKDTEVRLTVSRGVDMRDVPALTEKTEQEARAALTDAGLAVGTITQDYSETVPEGDVISQAQTQGTSLKHDTAVDFIVSKGREPLTVPTVTGTGADDARSQIEGLGLIADPSEAYSDTVTAGVVISQTQQPGSTLHRGDTVSYVVSRGPEMVEVPSVTGQQLEDAQAILENAGFTVKVDKVLGGYFNTVRQTDPAAGTSVPKGSTITVTVI